VFFDGLIQKSSLDVLLVAIFLYAVSRWVWRPATAPVVLAAVAAALISINRENARVLVPLAIAWLLLRRSPRMAAVFTAAVLLVLLPVGVRNYRAGGEFFVSTSQAGPNFYIGNHTGASGLYASLLPERGNARYEREDAKRLAETAVGHTLTAGGVSRYWIDRTVADIRKAPGSWLALLARKCLLAINVAEPPDAESLSAYAEQSSLLTALAWIDFGVLFPLALLGMWLERQRWRDLWLLGGIAASLLLSMAAFFVFARYRLPAVPVLAMFAAVPLVRASVPRERRAASWTAGLAIAAGAFVLCRVPFNVGDDETLLNVGKQLLADGRAADALPVLRESAARYPGYAIDAYTLGVALERNGDEAAAQSEFRRAVQLAPADARMRGALALALMHSGAVAESLPHFAESVRLAPADAPLQTNYGVALLQTGDVHGAVRHLEEGVRLDPRDVAARNALGSALARDGNLDAAVQQFQAAATIEPGNAQAHANLGLALAGRGEVDAARRELQQALALAKASGRSEETRQIEAALAQLSR
jgi:Flp pilus assembly protein TadD